MLGIWSPEEALLHLSCVLQVILLLRQACSPSSTHSDVKQIQMIGNDLVMMMTLSCYIATMQDCFRLYKRSLFTQLLIFIAYALSIPRFKPSASAIAQRVLDIGLHAAPVGVPVIMIFCSITAHGWLKPKSIEELRPGSLKIVGETEVVAFDKTGTLTGSLVSMHARPDVRVVTAVFIAILITSRMVHAHLLCQRPHRMPRSCLHVIACLVQYGQLFLWCVLPHSFPPARPEDFFGTPKNVIPPFWVEVSFSFHSVPCHFPLLAFHAHAAL